MVYKDQKESLGRAAVLPGRNWIGSVAKNLGAVFACAPGQAAEARRATILSYISTSSCAPAPATAVELHGPHQALHSLNLHSAFNMSTVIRSPAKDW